MNSWGIALLEIFGMLVGIPLALIILAIVFVICRAFHVVEWNWWWVALPLGFCVAMLILDKKIGLFG